MLLKTEADIEKFIDTNTEWREDTPFYKTKYYELGGIFGMMKKITRVIAFVADKCNYMNYF